MKNSFFFTANIILTPDLLEQITSQPSASAYFMYYPVHGFGFRFRFEQGIYIAPGRIVGCKGQPRLIKEPNGNGHLINGYQFTFYQELFSDAPTLELRYECIPGAFMFHGTRSHAVFSIYDKKNAETAVVSAVTVRD